MRFNLSLLVDHNQIAPLIRFLDKHKILIEHTNGEGKPNGKKRKVFLTPEAIKSLRADGKKGISTAVLCQRYNVSSSCVAKYLKEA